MRTVIDVACALLSTIALGGSTCMGGPPLDWMLELSIRGHHVEGAPVTWSDREVVLVGRDGQLWQFAPEEARNYRKSADRFYGYSPAELRSILRSELGGGFEVSGTGHYLVAHPRGMRDQWADRFEDLYRSFVHYFSVRGFTLVEPPFPLVGIVCRNRKEYSRYTAAVGSPMSGGTLGFYSNQTNRIALYDVGGGATGAAGWQQNAATVVHEATHQVAFNTGIHSRYTQPPLWVAEGLATMFEGVVGAGGGSDGPSRSRANPSRLAAFRGSVAPGHRPEILADLVATDRLFQAVPSAAYAEAWALTFYLVETQPARYADYLARTARRPAFERYSSKQRTADFTSVFGSDWRMLEARLLRFMEELR